MSLNLLTVYKCLVIQAFFMSSVYSVEVTRAEFLREISKAVGSYKTIGKKKEFCNPGYLSFINESSPKDGLRLSDKIFFGPFAKSSTNSKEEGYCSITEEYRYSSNSVRQVTKVHSCEKEHVKDESTSTQILEFKDNKLIYKSLESSIECHFEKVKEENVI